MNSILLKKIINIRNFNYIMIISFISTAIIFALTFIYFSIDCSISINKSTINREYIVYDITDDNILKNNDHIIFYGSDVYNLEPFFEIERTNGSKAGVTIKPLIDEKSITISDGNKIKENGQIICSKNFYPYYLTKYGEKDIINSKNLLNKTINIENKDYTIVGTFKNIPFETADTCYIGKEDFINLGIENGNDKIILIDDISNEENVTKYLVENNVKYLKVFETDETFIYLFFYIPLFIMLIMIVIMIDIIYYFIKKKIIKNLKFYGLLKSCGYSSKMILKHNLIENNILLLFIIPISLLLYGLGIIIVKKQFMYDYIYNNLYLNFPLVYYLLFLICFVMITNFTIIILSKKYLNYDANILIGEEN